MNTPGTKSPTRILFVENLRILLSALVVVVHMACTYGGPGGWAYVERGADFFSTLVLTIINATGQSFFMGLFFFIGAYFTHLSFQKKGLARFVIDRVIRLGIPLAFTYYLISPFTQYISWKVKHPEQADYSFMDIWTNGHSFGVGVMWFAEALIYFTLLYIVARYSIPWLRRTEKLALPKIESKHVLLGSIALGIITFFTRLIFPLFHRNHSLNFELGHFPQYIVLFVLGVMLARYRSKQTNFYQVAKKWMWYVLVMVVIVFPLIFLIGGAHRGNFSLFLGGFTWHSLAFSLWEQMTGIAIMVALTGIMSVSWNHQSKLAGQLSGGAYAVYVLHPPILVAISLLFIHWEAMHLLKFLVITPIALVASYGVAIVVKNMPLLRRIF